MRRSTRGVKAEPVEETNEETTTPAKKKKNEDEQSGSSKRSTSKKGAKSDVASFSFEVTTPKTGNNKNKKKKEDSEQPESSKQAETQPEDAKTEEPTVEATPKTAEKKQRKKKDVAEPAAEDQPESSKQAAEQLNAGKSEPTEEATPKTTGKKQRKKKYVAEPAAEDQSESSEQVTQQLTTGKSEPTEEPTPKTTGKKQRKKKDVAEPAAEGQPESSEQVTQQLKDVKIEEPTEDPTPKTAAKKQRKKEDAAGESSKEEPTAEATPKTAEKKQRKRKDAAETGSESSKRTPRQLKAVKQETPPEVSPKTGERRRKGRPPAIGSEKKKSGLPVNDAQDSKDLAEFRRAKAPKDILTVYLSEYDLSRFLAGAMRAADNELACPGCGNIFTSPQGITYHIQRCKESVIDWEPVHDSFAYEEVKARPWMWVNGKKKAKEVMAAAALKDGNGSIECVRASACETPSFSTAAAFIDHMNKCTVPTYNQFRGHPEEFRALEKKAKSTMIRLGMTANGGSLPCLSCGKLFNHKYGLGYHIDRCGFTDDNADAIPWKCYRCGFEGKVGDRETHLEECDVPPSEAAKPKKDRVSMRDMDGDELAELAGKRRRQSTGVSMAAGVIPAGASQTRITNSGLKRFKFRKSEAMQHNITITADLDRYRAAVAAAIENHEEQNESSSLCEMLRRRGEAQTTPWEKVQEGPYVTALRDKQSIGLRQRTLEHFAQSDGKVNSNSKRTTFPPLVEHPNLPNGELKRIGTFTAESFESECSPNVSVGYVGGPIASTHLAPTPLSETSECLAVLTFPDDENLVNTTTGKAHWRATDAYIQLWRVEKTREQKRRKNNDDSREVTRCDLSMWFVLRIEGRGLALAANWMPRPLVESSAILGYLAVAMCDGTILIYCIRKDSVPLPVDGRWRVVAPPPLIVLTTPTLEEVGDMKRAQRQERRGGQKQVSLRDLTSERLTRGGRSILEASMREGRGEGGGEGTVEGGVGGSGEAAGEAPGTSAMVTMADLEDVKPVGLIEAEGGGGDVEMGTGVELVKMPTAAPATEIVTPVRRTKAEQRKELIRMRLVKPEFGPPPPPPIISVSWSPFGDCSSIAAVDAAGSVLVWELREDLVEKEEVEGGEESLRPVRVLVDVDWVSPALTADWMDTNILGVSFAERMIRVLDVTTGECQLEENTVRTAGKALKAQGSCFEGVFIYQSEFYTATEAPETAVVYLAYGADRDGYFVVPLTNRHGLMVWAVGVSSSGVIGTAGADGRLQLSMNGKVVPRGCLSDLSVNLHTDPFLLIRNRVTEPVPALDTSMGEENEKPLPPPAYNSHEEVTSKMWLDIVCEDADTISGPPLPQGLLDSRVESLNAITLSAHSAASPMDHVVVTGGQAGLLFARTCHIEEKGVNNPNWLNIRKWSNPSSKEGTPRPKSRNSVDPTPRPPSRNSKDPTPKVQPE